ncbi:hypothetical protein KUTeg_002428 [Tegillarca granosa]|uniref:Uncharacterized protein n=1 Tax=Tegillarca granosa TaxID=220873 RepID=A0ABQ9FUB4_TEGGR|nr:hypothetical protein KUTeg_002428 [Tegillarca granosa]
MNIIDGTSKLFMLTLKELKDRVEIFMPVFKKLKAVKKYLILIFKYLILLKILLLLLLFLNNIYCCDKTSYLKKKAYL